MAILQYVIAILAVGGYFISREWLDPYHLLVGAGLDIIFLAIIFIVKAAQKKDAEFEGEEADIDEEGNKVGEIVGRLAKAVLLAVIMMTLASFAIKLADTTPLPTVFYDKERLAF